MTARHRTYLAAHGGKSLLWHAYDLLFAFLLTQYMGLPPVVMGLIAMSLMLFGAAMDLVTGYFIAKGPETAKRLVAMQLAGAVLSSCAFAAVFASRNLLPPALHAICFGLIFQLAYKLYDVPQNALTSILTDRPDEVLSISTGRYLLSGIAKIAVSASAFLLIEQDHGPGARVGLHVFTSIVCLPAIASAFLLYRRLGTGRDPGRKRHDAVIGSSSSVMSRMPKGMPRLLLATFVYSAFAAVMSRALPYLDNGSSTLVCFAVGSLVSLPILRKVASRLGEHVAFLAAAAMKMVAAILIAVPAFAVDGASYLSAAIYGGGLFSGTMLLWGTAANLVHRHSDSSRSRSDAIAYATFTFASKIGIACSLMLLACTLEIDSASLESGASGASVSLGSIALLVCAGAAISAISVYPTMRLIRTEPLQP